jgi:hypothetical protein
MKARTYALMLIMLGAGAFLAVVGANLAIDPQGVFGTGLFGSARNVNDRYASVAAYQANPGRYDGLLFGSSRALDIPLDELSRRMNGVSFAKFAVVGGMLDDHVAALEFVVRDKAATGRRLKTVFLLLDVDLMGQRPYTNRSNQFLMPPALSGEDPSRFWWKNLAAIQFEAWRSAIVSARAEGRSTSVFGIGIGTASAQPTSAAVKEGVGALIRVTRTAEFSRQLGLLGRLVALCRGHAIELVVATPPLSPAHVRRYDPTDFAHAVESAARIVPLWDFTDRGGASAQSELWIDVSHFHPRVARMMLMRMFGDPVPESWRGFGQYRAG